MDRSGLVDALRLDALLHAEIAKLASSALATLLAAPVTASSTLERTVRLVVAALLTGFPVVASLPTPGQRPLTFSARGSARWLPPLLSVCSALRWLSEGYSVGDRYMTALELLDGCLFLLLLSSSGTLSHNCAPLSGTTARVPRPPVFGAVALLVLTSEIRKLENGLRTSINWLLLSFWVKQRVLRLRSSANSSPSREVATAPPGADSFGSEVLLGQKCPLCNLVPTNPTAARCGHVFCYFCHHGACTESNVLAVLCPASACGRPLSF